MTDAIDTTRITGLPEASHSESGDFMAIDKAGGTARKLSVASLRAEAAADATNAVSAITSAAQSATAQALDAKNAANAAATAANTATTAANTAVTRANAAAEAAEGVILDSIPTMSPTVKGGAKAGDGLSVDDAVLSLGPLVKSGNPVEGCALYEVSGQGWSEQVSTVGKNLLPMFTTGTDHDVLFTVHDDGSVSATGTAGSSNAAKGSSVTLPAGTYTFSIGEVDSAVANGYVSAGGDTIARNTGTPGPTFTLSEETEVRAVVRIVSGKTADGTTFYPMIEAGSTATSYEPYSGGAASPRPDWPQEIEVCRGRNLFSAPENKRVDGGTSTGYRYKSGEGTSFISEVEKNTNYTISSSDTGNRFRIVLFKYYPTNTYNTDSRSVYDTETITSYMSYTFNSGEYSYVMFTLETVEFLQTATAQLEFGSTPSPYVPYGHVGIDIYDSQSQHVATVPVPLPLKSDGTRWAGAVGDYADSLAIDSAGGYAWTCETGETTVSSGTAYTTGSEPNSYGLYNSNVALNVETAFPDAVEVAGVYFLAEIMCAYGVSNPGGISSADLEGVAVSIAAGKVYVRSREAFADFQTWLAAHPLGIYYAKSVSATESGYVSLPMLPNGCTVTCPELAEVGVSWMVEGLRPVMERIANEREYIEYLISEIATS